MTRSASKARDGSGMSVVVLEREQAAREVAGEIAALVSERAREGRDAVIGLPTGSTPLGVYRELIRLRREGALDAAHLITFNLDEYLGVDGSHPRSFRSWMDEVLFAPLGLARSRTFVPDGNASEAGAHCGEFESAIERAGGIDLQLLGLGLNGHIGFNEPGSPRDSRTRVVELEPCTREEAAGRFGGLAQVPTHAITLGIATILEARRIRLLAFGQAKRAIVERVLDGEVGPHVPATFLRSHPDVRIYLDRAAAGEHRARAL